MNAIGASSLALLTLLVVFAPRRWAMLGMMTGVLYLTHGLVINLFGFNLFAIRILEIAAFARVIKQMELSSIQLNNIDRTFLVLYVYGTLVFLMRTNVDQANHIGMMIDSIFCYFIFRGLIINSNDIKWFLGVFVLVLLPYVLLVSIEMITNNNPFTLIGGLNFGERGGRLRCMGSFRHPSLLGGALGASFIPLYIALFIGGNKRLLAFSGIALCSAIVFLSNSGGPLSAMTLGIIGWLCWIIRANMSFVRRLLVFLFIILGSIMKAPVWYLLAKISSISGGDGWHRSYLMDVAFRNIDKWWMAGMDLNLTGNWFPYQLEATGAADITNQYLAFGLDAGMLCMALFILLLVRAFQAIGQVLTVARSDVKRPNDNEYLLWGFGCTLLVHISTWLGITYNFDQSYVIWLMQLAAISSILQECKTLTVLQEGIEAKQQPVTMNELVRFKYHIYKAKRN